MSWSGSCSRLCSVPYREQKSEVRNYTAWCSVLWSVFVNLPGAWICGFICLLFIYLWFLLVQASSTVLYSNVNLHYLFLISTYWDDLIFWCMQIQTVVFKSLPTTCTVRNVLSSPCSVLQEYSAECVCPLWSPPPPHSCAHRPDFLPCPLQLFDIPKFPVPDPWVIPTGMIQTRILEWIQHFCLSALAEALLWHV